MKIFKFLILGLIIAVSIVSCGIARKPLETVKADNNQDYNVSFLFSHDGCNVYRFRDKGQFVYFTNCAGEAISVADSLHIVNKTSLLSKN